MSQYAGIRSEAGLIPYEILDQIAKEEAGLGQQAKDFGLLVSRRLTDEIARAWSDAQDYWHIFRRRSSGLPEDETGTTLTRKWVSDLLDELLGYQLTYQPSGVIVGGKNYPISHRAGSGEESPPVHIEGFRIDLDRRPQGRRISPHALVQEYLNNTDGHLWGIVTNGLVFRLLRDTSRTSRPAYLEFDLQSILEDNRFNEFAIFYRVCHRSRLPLNTEHSSDSWLEKYFQKSAEQGGRVRDKLRDGVEKALKILGTGFVRHPQNGALRELVRTKQLTATEFHRQLLRLVYRILFLMVAEERRMIAPEGPESERHQHLYDSYYSTGRSRTLAEKVIERSTFCDLWIGLQESFALFEDGADTNALGIPPLNGDLFSIAAVKNFQGTQLYNDDVLEAIRCLSLFEDNGVLQRVNYGALDVEELGSVYESLLDYHPVFTEQPEGMTFDMRTGSERKSTGSYYTRPELVRELIESALVPVMQDHLATAKDDDPAIDRLKKEKALLSMSICDPACGSGHFLLAAARRLGRELAKVRTGEEEPTPREFHLAVRDVISNCIYGVDVNPLAVDLCKLALWLEGHWAGKPLTFLDDRIKCGNSLVGVLDMEVLKSGIPDEAFMPMIGDDKKVASVFKKTNQTERKGQRSLQFDPLDHLHKYAAQSGEFVAIREEAPADVRRKKEAYEKARQEKDWWHDWVAANLWTAAFFVPLTAYNDAAVPTHEKFIDYLSGRGNPQMEASAIALADELRFFHWPLEFPRVFERGGFDLVLGNPPWERIKLQEEEYWANDPIGDAKNKAERLRLITQYRNSSDVDLRKRVLAFEEAKRRTDAQGKFIRKSGRYGLTATGDVNTYAVFTELATQAIAPRGRVGVIVPSAIATGDTTSRFFSHLVDSHFLVSMKDFLEARDFFQGLESRDPFCLLTLKSTGGRPVETAAFTFQMLSINELSIRERQVLLTADDFALLNPNTRNCPIFRTRVDAELTKKLYLGIPILLNENTGADPWGLKFAAMFHMSNDSDLFREGPDDSVLRLYEAKMIHQFDHRWQTFAGTSSRMVNTNEKEDPTFLVQPRYWVPTSDVVNRTSLSPTDWFIALRRFARANDERTLIAAVLPLVGAGDSIVAIQCPRYRTDPVGLCLAANLNSLVLDYVARQKLGSANVNFFVLKQLPVIGPEAYTPGDIEFVSARTLQLINTASDTAPLVGRFNQSAVVVWNATNRARVRAELDAYYAHLYGLTRDELRYILDPKDVFGQDFPSETFRVLKEREAKEFAEYRTRRLVLEAFDRLAATPRFQDEMRKRQSAISLPQLASA